jgi:hypothetical protein
VPGAKIEIPVEGADTRHHMPTGVIAEDEPHAARAIEDALAEAGPSFRIVAEANDYGRGKPAGARNIACT